MNKYRRAFLLLVFLLPLASAQTTVRPSATGLPQAKAGQTNSRVRTIAFESKLVGKTLPYSVLLPVDYDKPAARSKRYPVLYLLHGLFGHYDNWITRTKLSDYGANYSMIIVTPEGNDSWYTDSASVPTDKYETYVMEELIPDVQSRYRTIETRAGRAIAGLSMGGYGALKFGVKHPESFVFVGSMSGALGAASWTEADLHGLEAIWKTLFPIFGPEDSATRKANDVNKLYGEVPSSRVVALPYVYLDCGTEDPLLSSSRSLAAILFERKIPHEYRELPGTHAWPYWDTQVQEVLRIAARKVREPAVSATRK
ncbi:MAG TPA: alpha/beta hydrolase family protein [Pyrinomonadaceae bacterium]